MIVMLLSYSTYKSFVKNKQANKTKQNEKQTKTKTNKQTKTVI